MIPPELLVHHVSSDNVVDPNTTHEWEGIDPSGSSYLNPTKKTRPEMMVPLHLLIPRPTCWSEMKEPLHFLMPRRAGRR